MSTKLKGTTRQRDSAGKLQKDQDITPFTICQAQMAKPYPQLGTSRKWAEEHVVSGGGVTGGSREQRPHSILSSGNQGRWSWARETV